MVILKEKIIEVFETLELKTIESQFSEYQLRSMYDSIFDEYPEERVSKKDIVNAIHAETFKK